MLFIADYTWANTGKENEMFELHVEGWSYFLDRLVPIADLDILASLKPPH